MWASKFRGRFAFAGVKPSKSGVPSCDSTMGKWPPGSTPVFLSGPSWKSSASCWTAAATWGTDMTAAADIAVVGLGAAGSATLQALARRGHSVIGIDRFHPPHALGSTHGRSRIIREAYYESPVYVPLVQRAYEEWARIERECGRQLFWQTGGLMIGSPEGELVAGARRSAVEHGLSYQWLTPEEVRREFPVFR